MTAPTVPSRPSTSVAFRIAESIGGTLVALLVGGALFVPGLMGFLSELHVQYQCDEPLHAGHLSLFVGLMVAGGVAVRPRFGQSISSIVVSVAPYIPMFGGKRAGDPQPPSK